MRLINAYTLPDALFQKHVHYGEGTEMYLSFADILDVIDNAPTVDAIPVEWLKGMRDLMHRSSSRAAGDMLNRVIEIWQKEQEAR